VCGTCTRRLALAPLRHAHRTAAPGRSVQGEAALRRALESGALRPHNISQMNPEGWAPLHCAAAAGRVPEVGRRLTLMIL
jgi:hypothetical protein